LKRWLPFLLVNIIISAATTLLVLTIWNKSNTSSSIEIQTPAVANPSQVEQTPQNVLPPTDTSVIQIANVFAAGDLQNELMVIERIGEGALNLIGWKIIDQNNNSFVFPEIELVKGQISIYSRSGNNTVNTLFWGSEEPIWEAGETVKVLDSAGNERAVFEIP
jgi:hypothetical protein